MVVGEVMGLMAGLEGGEDVQELGDLLALVIV